MKIIYLQLFVNCALFSQEINLNIFVHGTVKPYFKVRNLATIIAQGDVQNSPYGSYNYFMRHSDILKKNQAIQDIGLHQVDLNDIGPGKAATAAALLHNFFDGGKNNIYYTFGWSGLLSYKLREQEGKNLYEKVEDLVSTLKSRGFEPKINIIGYSHGGTVVLNMVHALKSGGKELPFKVNKLILLGMPVQQDTDYLVDNPLFENIYHFYSTSDYVQAVDHASSANFACHKRFYDRKNFKMPTKLKQINIGIIKTVLNQCKTCLHKCRRVPNLLIKQAYHQNPGHGEFWLFGWSLSGYRKNYPIYPMPVLVFIPLILNHMEQLNLSNHISVDINPRSDKIIIKDNQNSFNKPFIEYEKFQALKKELIDLFAPKNLSKIRSRTKKGARWYSFFKHDPCRLQRC